MIRHLEGKARQEAAAKGYNPAMLIRLARLFQGLLQAYKDIGVECCCIRRLLESMLGRHIRLYIHKKAVHMLRGRLGGYCWVRGWAPGRLLLGVEQCPSNPELLSKEDP